MLYPGETDLFWEVAQRSVRNWGGRGKNLFSSSHSLGWKNGTEKRSASWYKEKQGITGRKEKTTTGRETLVKGVAMKSLLLKGVGAVPTPSLRMLLVPGLLGHSVWGRTFPPVGQQLQEGRGERKNRVMVPFWASFLL